MHMHSRLRGGARHEGADNAGQRYLRYGERERVRREGVTAAGSYAQRMSAIQVKVVLIMPLNYKAIG